MILRDLLNFLLLLAMKAVCTLLWRVDLRFIGDVPPGDPWANLRVVAILHHTSLFEPIYSAGTPVRWIWRLARHGVVPIAQKTLDRPVAGLFFRLIARHVLPLTRKRDHTWRELLSKVDDGESMLVILPEGRMMRRDGLDSKGQPMNVRGGIADVLSATDGGRLLLAYSGGLHHIQAPGDRFPRLFRKARMNCEVLDIVAYRGSLGFGELDPTAFRHAVTADLERRRDLHCPTP